MSWRQRAIAGAGTGVLALLVLLGWWLAGTGTRSHPTRPEAAAVESRNVAADASGTTGDALPPSLRGTRPDGGVRFDGRGNLVTDAELRRYFDWYLAAIGEQELPAIRLRLARDLALRMDPPQIAAALAWFDRYCGYLRASATLAGISDLQQRLQAAHALRVRMLGSVATDGFFGEEETEALRVLALKRAHTDPGLDADERMAMEKELQAASPGYSEAQRESALRQTLADMEGAFDRLGASAVERHAERSALVGPEAADRFAELDRARADWDARLQAYSRQILLLQAEPALSAGQRQARVRQLLAPFSAEERRRIAALEQAGALR